MKVRQLFETYEYDSVKDSLLIYTGYLKPRTVKNLEQLQEKIKGLFPNFGVKISKTKEANEVNIKIVIADEEKVDTAEMQHNITTMLERPATPNYFLLRWPFTFKHLVDSYFMGCTIVGGGHDGVNLEGVHEKLEARSIRINTEVNGGVIDLLKISSLKTLTIIHRQKSDWAPIIKRHLQNQNIDQRVSEATEELFNSGLKDLI